MDWKWVLLLPHIISLYITLGSEVVVQVNTKKWIYYVPERFLSLTVDPLTLGAASPLTQESFNMAKGLSPSFVRIGGIGTNALIFGKEFMVNSSTVSESQWDSVNDFARGTGLDIIASLNPSLQVEGVWDSQNSLELISYSNKKRYNVVWQLGYDVRGYNASGADIGRDLVRLATILDGFPKYAGSPVFSPDILSVSGSKQIHFVKDMLMNAGNSLGALILQPKFMNGDEPEDPYELISSMTSELDTYVWNKEVRFGKAIPKKPVWIAEPTASRGSFREAMKLVKRIGVAARIGTQIYMRQAGATCLKTTTPEFWFSLLYKNLVGQGVLDSKIVSQNQSDLNVFSHCTASLPQDKSVLDTDWSYEKGAVTLFGVNESPEPVKLVLKVTSKEEPLHIYVLTSDVKNERGKNPATLLNGQELMLSPTWDLPVLSPKVKRPSKSSSVMLPGNSIFFIVMPDSKIRTCSIPPLATPDLNLSELTKRLRIGQPKKAETLEGEEEIEPSDDLTNEGVYVTFAKKKRHDAEANSNNARPDIIGKSLMETIISKLSPKKTEKTTIRPVNDEEMPVYITFNENSFLNKLAEGVKEELKEKDQQEFDAKKDKYAHLTAAMTNTTIEVSAAKSAELSHDVIKIEPVMENSSAPTEEPDLESVPRMRRSSNEDPPSGTASPNKPIGADYEPIEIIQKINECKRTGAAMDGKVGDVSSNLRQVTISVINPDHDTDQVNDKTRNSRHIGEGTEEESNNESVLSDEVKKATGAEQGGQQEKYGDDEEVAKTTSALVKVVQETEKVESVSESPDNVMIPPNVSEKKLDEIMLEAAKSKSEPEPDSGSPSKEEMSSQSEDASKVKNPQLSGETGEPSTIPGITAGNTAFPQVQTLLRSQPLSPSILTQSSQLQSSAGGQLIEPLVTIGDSPDKQVLPGSQILTNPIFTVPQPNQQQGMIPSSQMKNNHVLKIPLPTPPRNAESVFRGENVPTVMSPMLLTNPPEPLYNEQKENAINNILTKMVNEEDTKLANVPPDAVKLGVVERAPDSQLVAVPLPGNDTILMESNDAKIINKDEGTSGGIKTLANGSQSIELPNEDNPPSVKVSRQVDEKTSTNVQIAVTPPSKTATLSAPLEQATTSTPAGPVSPFKSSVGSNKLLQTNQVRETLKAPSPDELRERFKSLRDKMLELRSQYVAAREKKMEEIKKQVASRGPLPSSEADETIKNTIKRREAELKEWFKKFDKREAKTSPIVVPLEENIDVKPRPRRLSLFTNSEEFDMAKFFDEEPSESSNTKRSLEMSSQNKYSHLPMAPDMPLTLPKAGTVGKHIFPLDTKTHGIVYNNKIYPAKLFGYIDRSDEENIQESKNEQAKEVMRPVDEKVGGRKFGDQIKVVKTSMQIPKSRERIAFVPRDAFVREMKSDFIPVIILPPEDLEDVKADDLSPIRAKRSTFDTLEDQFHKLKEDLLPKISSWIKNLSENPPWKRDLERSSRNRRSIEDFLRTNDLRSLMVPKHSGKREDTTTKDIEDFVVHKVDKGEDEIYATAKKYSGLVEKIGEQALKEEKVDRQSNNQQLKSDDIGYCEEIGTSKESIIRDPFENPHMDRISTGKTKTVASIEREHNKSLLDSSKKKNEQKSAPKIPANSQDTNEEFMFASVIAEKIKEFFETVTNLISSTDSTGTSSKM